jgi:DNA-binding response OmpR family regulator
MSVATIDQQRTDRVAVWCATDGERGSVSDALAASGIAVVGLEQRPPVVVIELDRDDNLARLHALRKHSDAPIVVLIDGNGMVDPVAALDAGADDFVVQPCLTRELVAKLHAWFRRVELDHRVRASGARPLDIDLDARDVRVRGNVVALPPREFDLLAFLAQRPRRAFTRSELLAQVWRASDAWLGAATVTEHVRRLRLRIEPNPARPRFLRTVRRVGYSFDPDGA